METIRFMWKDDTSGTGDCPAIYQAPGGYYVQGQRVTAAKVRARLGELGAAHDSGLGDGEDYLFVPANVIDRIRDL